jgi:putative oxidoreductase
MPAWHSGTAHAWSAWSSRTPRFDSSCGRKVNNINLYFMFFVMRKKKKRNYFYHAIRIITGILFIIVSASKFGFLPSAVKRPEMFTSEGFAFISAINATGYLFPAVGIVSLVCGLAFLLNRYVAFAAVILIPITANFALFHIFLGFGIDSVFHLGREGVAYVFLALNLYMLYSQREKYAVLLKS